MEELSEILKWYRPYAYDGAVPSHQGLTLLELLLALGIMAILVAIAILVMRPSQELTTLRDQQRQQDISVILQALLQYAVDHHGDLPEGIPMHLTEICRSGTPDCSGLIDLAPLSGLYLERVPLDPRVDDPRSTGYAAMKDVEGRVTVSAPLTEGSSVPIVETR